jgi:hypothetical protein
MKRKRAKEPGQGGSQVLLRVLAHAVWTQLVLDELLGVAAFAAADAEKVAWTAAQAALRSRGYAL